MQRSITTDGAPVGHDAALTPQKGVLDRTTFRGAHGDSIIGGQAPISRSARFLSALIPR